MNATLTVLILTHNNAETLPRTLTSVAWCERIVIYDRGSTDQTLALVRETTAAVHFHPAAGKAAILGDALAGMETDWVLVLNPHEWVSETLKHELRAFLSNPPEGVHGVKLAGQLYLNGQPVGGGLGRTACGFRLLKPDHARITRSLFPELGLEGGHPLPVRQMEAPLCTEPYASVDALFEAANHRATLHAYNALENGVAPSGLLSLIAATKWAGFKALILQGGLFGGFSGLCLSVAQSMEVFLTHAKLRQLSATGKS